MTFAHSNNLGRLGDGKLMFQNTVEHLNPGLFLLIQLYIPHGDDMFAEQLAHDRIVEHQHRPPPQSGPPAPSTRVLFLLPAFPRSVGLRPIAPPQKAPSPSSNRLTAIPSLRRPTRGIPLSGRPRHPPAPHALLIAGRSRGWCCHSQLLGQVVPLAGAAHAEYDAFQHLPLTHRFAPLWFGWVHSEITGSNSLPQIIWYFPYHWQSLPLPHHSPPPNFPLS